MEHTIHDRTAGRVEADPDAGDVAASNASAVDPAAPRDSASPDPGTAPATRPAELTPTAAGFRIRFCGWCKQVDVRGARRDTDVIAILIVGKVTMACWNGKPMIVQDGICEACAVALKDGRVSDERNTSL